MANHSRSNNSNTRNTSEFEDSLDLPDSDHDLPGRRRRNRIPKSRRPVLSSFNNRIDNDQREQDELKRRKKEAKNRKNSRQGFMYQSQPDPHNKGLAGQIEHINGLTAEGLAGEAFADLFIFIGQFCFNTDWLHQQAAYQQAKDQEIQIIAKERQQEANGLQAYVPNAQNVLPDIYRLDERGRPMRNQAKHLIAPNFATEKELEANGYFKRGMRLTYSEVDGVFPVAYQMDPTTGELDYHSEIENGKATPLEQIANGFVPEPSYIQGLKNVVSKHLERMRGYESLDPEAKMWLYGNLNHQPESKNRASDSASDLRSMAKPAPRPT